MKKKSIVLNKLIYAGCAILDLSKMHMCRCHYDFIKPKHGDRAKLLFTDTDSLCYHVQTVDFDKDMKTDGALCDVSNFQHPATKQFFDNTSEKVVGKFKGETDGMLICEYVGLRPKMYSLTYEAAQDKEKDKATGKGVKRSHLNANIKHATAASNVSVHLIRQALNLIGRGDQGRTAL